MKRIISNLKYSALMIGTCLTLSPPAHALMVFDPANLAQAVAQVEELVRAYEKQIEQLDQAVRQADAITGTRNMGSLLNGALEGDLRRSFPDELIDMINLPSAGRLGTSASATQGIYNDYITEYNPIAGADFLTYNPVSELAKSHDRNVGATYASLSASEAFYKRASERIEVYEQMLDELDASDDMKTSIDLLARIVAENGIAMNELARMNALKLQLDASLSNQEITTKRRVSDTIRYNPTKAAQSFN